jgi:hypothetical protein
MRPFVLGLLLPATSLLGGSGCSAVPLAREATLAVEEGVAPRARTRATSDDGARVEVRCGLGDLCAAVQVVHVQRQRSPADVDADGAVQVTLQNRTLDHVAVQLALEVFDDERRAADRTGFHDVILAPRNEGTVTLVVTGAPDDALIVHLRPRRA